MPLLCNDNVNVRCGRRGRHTVVPAAFVAAPLCLGGESAVPTQLLMNHFAVTAALAHINTTYMRCILF